ncbi:MAG: tRNA threonylcarbamoyladenosine dehydratase [Bacilli bacterium]|nr:tRNA threonylcarbamoyladenosine dehydratase [Bacilli bacterium]
MSDQFSRFRILIGEDAQKSLLEKRVCVFGLGGVGGTAAESLGRSGIGHLYLVDDDVVSLTNINRQIIATHKDIGRPKVEVMKERILSINPNIDIEVRQALYLPKNAESFDLSKFDYVVDAIDTVSAKLDIIERCSKLGVKVISAMGCGNKMDPTKLVVKDIYETSYDPLAKIMRSECRKRGIGKLKVVYSTEKALEPILIEEDKEELKEGKKSIPGSSPFVPPVAGYILSSEVIKDLLNFDPNNRK